MKTYISFSFLLLLFLSCKEDEGQVNNDNPFLLNPSVNVTLNLNLPEYKNLTFNGTTYELLGHGNRGIIIYNSDGSQYFAYDMADPNHVPNTCSKIIQNGIEGSCSCNDGNKYSLVTGQILDGKTGYPLLQYRAFREGNTLTIRN